MQVEVTMKDGSKTIFPYTNLENFKRLLGHQIKGMRPIRNDYPKAEIEEAEIVSTATIEAKKRGRPKVNQ